MGWIVLLTAAASIALVTPTIAGSPAAQQSPTVTEIHRQFAARDAKIKRVRAQLQQDRAYIQEMERRLSLEGFAAPKEPAPAAPKPPAPTSQPADRAQKQLAAKDAELDSLAGQLSAADAFLWKLRNIYSEIEQQNADDNVRRNQLETAFSRCSGLNSSRKPRGSNRPRRLKRPQKSFASLRA